MDGSPLMLAVYILGIIGSLYAFVESGVMPFEFFAVSAVTTAVITSALWYVYFYRQKLFLPVIAGVCFVCVLLCAWQITSLSRMFRSFIKYGSFDSLSFGILLLFLITVVFILFSLEFVLRRHGILFLLTAALVVLGPLAELKTGPVSIVLIVVFQFGFFVINMTGGSPKKHFENKNRHRAVSASVTVIVILFILSYIPGYIVQAVFEDQLFNAVYQADSVIKDAADYLTGNYGTSGINGNVARGNLQQTGAPAFSLTVKELPDSRLYFRGFTGGYYDKQFWQTSETWQDALGYFQYLREEGLDPEKNDAQTMILIRSEAREDYDEYENYDDEYYDEYRNDPYYEDYGDVYSENDGVIYDGAIVGTSDYYQMFGNIGEYTLYKVYLGDYSGYITRWEMKKKYSEKIFDLLERCFDGIPDEMLCKVTYSKYGWIYITDYETGGYVFSVTIYPSEVNDNGTASFHADVYDTQAVYQKNLELERRYADYIENGYEDVLSDYSASVYVGMPYYLDSAAYDEEYGKNRSTAYNVTLRDDFGTREYYGDGSFYISIDAEKDPWIYEVMNYPMVAANEKTADVPGSIVQSQIDDVSQGNYLRITHHMDMGRSLLMPYFYGRPYGEIEESITNTSSVEYMNYYVKPEAADMSSKWKELPIYEAGMERYIKSIGEMLTDYPADRLPRLTELCEKTDLGEGYNVNDVTTFILYTLQNNAEYSTTPGSVPWNKDTVEYFLFDNHKGFCVHYASAAANMYRMFGIPCRYVAGYVVDPDAFEPNDNTYYKYRTEVTDYSAHAWVEIFLKDYGWVPVEVTPDDQNHMHALYPGYDEAEMNRIMQEYGWTFRDKTISADADGGNGGAAAFFATGRGFAAGIVLLPFIAAAVFVIVVFIRHLIIVKRDSKALCRRSFDGIIRALHFSGKLGGMNGSERGFAQKLSSSADCISEEQAERLIGIMEQDSFSAVPADEEQNGFVRSVRMELCREIYSKLPWYKKPVYKYIKALI